MQLAVLPVVDGYALTSAFFIFLKTLCNYVNVNMHIYIREIAGCKQEVQYNVEVVL